MRPIRRIPLRSEGNAYYPLPPDYFDGGYTADGQRQARVDALRQWLLYTARAGDTAEHRALQRSRKAEAYLAGLDFFDRYYLQPMYGDDGAILFDPGFYRGTAVRTPRFHWDIDRATVLYKNVAAVGPRGSAKSFKNRKAIMYRMVTAPRYPVVYCTATDSLCTRFGDDTKHALYFNQRLHEDFSPEPEFEGPLKPNRGDGQTGMGAFSLSNRSTLYCISALSTQRGHRPLWYILDDPEHDPTSPSAERLEQLRVHFAELITIDILPMLQQPETSFLWTGTFISQQHYLWRVMQTKKIEGPDGTVTERSEDPLFGKWCRIVQPIAIEEPNPKFDDTRPEDTRTNARVRLRSCWPEMWPSDEEEKVRLNLLDTARTLSDIREEVGEHAWWSEYMCRPGLGLGAFFPAITSDDHGYTLSNLDAAYHEAPWNSSAIISWWRTDPETKHRHRITQPLRTFLENASIFVCVDTSFTSSVTSDYKVAHCMAVTPDADLFSLDIWRDRCDESVLVSETLRMALRWRATIYPEVIRSGQSILRALYNIIDNKAAAFFSNVAYVPGVIPLKVPNSVSKCARISSLRWRFLHNKIRLPFDLDTSGSPYEHLFAQIRNFKNKGGDDTGLTHDDDLDTLAMSGYVAGLPVQNPAPDAVNTTDPLERLRNGETVDEQGFPLILYCRDRLTPQDIAYLLERNSKLPDKNTPYTEDSYA